jgi:hypothetical protein
MTNRSTVLGADHEIKIRRISLVAVEAHSDTAANGVGNASTA